MAQGTTDKILLEWYMRGFNDELRGTSTHESDNQLENRAYMLGALDAIAGDDMPSIDYKSDEETLKLIKDHG